MFDWTISFLVIALIAGLLGFTGIAGVAVGMAKVIFFISLFIWIVAAMTVGTFFKKK